MNPIKDEWRSEDGSVRLILGDGVALLGEWREHAVDAIVTDPPYSMNAFDGSGTMRKYGMSRKDNWDKPVDAEDVLSILQVGFEHIIWGGNYYADVLPKSKGWLVWTKPDAVPSMASCELAWTDLPINAKHISHTIAATNAERVGFPAQKPLAVMLFSLGFLADGGRDHPPLVCDPFMGSGTTGVACVRTGRRFVGIEIEPKYWEIAVRRVKAELERFPLLEKPARMRQRELVETCA